MGFETIYDKDGKIIGQAIVCTRGGRKCQFCRARSTKQCDFAVNGGTCDVFMCDSCATNVGPNVDYCPKHKDLAR